MLHVGVREVDWSTRGLARIRERQVAGVDEPVDGLTGRELRDDGIQMNGVLRLRATVRRTPRIAQTKLFMAKDRNMTSNLICSNSNADSWAVDRRDERQMIRRSRAAGEVSTRV